MKVKVIKMIPTAIEKEIKIPKIKNVTNPHSCTIKFITGGGDSVHENVECSKIKCSECLFYAKNIKALRDMDKES